MTWNILFIAAVGALVFHIVSVTLAFGEYRVSVTVDILHQTELTFPAVTICNMSPVKRSAMGSLSSSSAKKKRRKKRSIAGEGM